MAGQANMTSGRGLNLWRIAGWGLAAALLLTPLVAMQVTNDVKWGPVDFAAAAILIGGLGLAIELAVRRSANLAWRAGAALAALTAFALIWINLAVGVIGDEGNPANLLFAAVLAVALAGALAARFRAKGMALAMAAAGVAQLLVAAVAFVANYATPPELGLTLAFALPWLLSAGLFRRAAQSEASTAA
jgi:hypothetical protein